MAAFERNCAARQDGFQDHPATTPRHADAGRNVSLNTAQILASVGEVAYDWHIDTDILAWSPNVTDVLLVGSAESVSTGRDYAQLIEA